VRRAAIVVVSFLLFGCANSQQGLWLKPGASTDDFNKDKYACMQQSQQPSSAAYVNQYGGASNSNIITNGNLLNACLSASGWHFTQMSDPNAFNAAMSVEITKLVLLCSQPDLQPIFAKKMACKPKDATPEQLADKLRISESERAALMKWRNAVEECNQRMEAITRQYGGPTGELMATETERSVASNQQLAAQFSEGHLTWGEYNKGRIDIVLRTEADQKTFLH
jgi:hypothetical protein